MHPSFPHQLSITWKMTVLEVTPEGIDSPCCQKCGCELDLHQPGDDHPEQLLGTCSQCGAWHMIEVAPDGTEAFLFDIPGLDFVREKLAEARIAAESKRSPVTANRLINVGVRGRFG